MRTDLNRNHCYLGSVMHAFVDPELMLDLVRLRMEELRPKVQYDTVTSEPNSERLQRRDQMSAAREARSSTVEWGRSALLRLRARP
ncbi:MAG TPA: hypothetical protein VKI99_16905 [Candidatus Dormibacteraeota bacterium]|nr:hypothetical protein [Candidatus Dormibacteraeota bacterium]